MNSGYVDHKPPVKSSDVSIQLVFGGKTIIFELRAE